MGKHLVLIGGGHAHMVTMARIPELVSRGHRVTVIGPSPYHYYSGMGPGMLGTTYSPDDIRFATKRQVEERGGRFILDRVTRIDPEKRRLRLAENPEITYDVLSCNAGSYVPQEQLGGGESAVFSVKPIETLLQAQKTLRRLTAQNRCRIAIVGGGPSSAEIAGNIRQLCGSEAREIPEIHILCGSRFMGRFPEKVRRLVRVSLEGRGIVIREDCRVNSLEGTNVVLHSGERVEADLIFMALGVRPSKLFADSALATGPDGGLLVNSYLQAVDYPEIFGGGDCIYFQSEPLDKVGVYAVRQNPILYHNLLASLEGDELQEFQSGGEYLLIFNLGEGLGVLHKGFITFAGGLAFRIKDYIDRRFMRRFQ